MSDLTIAARLRRFFREAATDITLRQIKNFWEDEEFTPGEVPANETSSRRELWGAYENAVDWSNDDHVRRVLRVYECLLPDTDDPSYLSFVNALQRDGLDVSQNGQIIPAEGAAPGPRVVAGRYELDSTHIGNGGYGDVFLATDLTVAGGADRRRVAIKIMLPRAMEDPENVRRFEREIRIMRDLSSPHVLPIYDSGYSEADGWWYTMPVAEGGSLLDYVRQYPSGLAVERILEIMKSVCAGVASMHNVGYLHRDLSPGNVLRLGGDWVVCDFGLSVGMERDTTILTRTGFGGGTPSFYAPEQTSGMRDVTEAADIYSLGKLVQFMSTGVWPDFDPALTNPLRRVIVKATHIKADQRYATVQDLEQALTDAIEVPVPAVRTDADIHDAFLTALRAGSLDAEEIPRLLEWLKGLDPMDPGVDLFYLNLMPKLSVSEIASMWTSDPTGYGTAFENFCNIALNFESFRFEDVDEPGRFAERSARATASPGIMSLAIQLLARLGREKNRWLLRELAVKLVRGVEPGVYADAVAEGFAYAGPGATMWTLRDFNIDELDVNTRNKIKNTLAKVEGSQ